MIQQVTFRLLRSHASPNPDLAFCSTCATRVRLWHSGPCWKLWRPVAEGPRQTPETQKLVIRLLLSHQRAFGRPLLTCTDQAQELFSSEMAVLAHDNSEDPRLIYANAIALRLWERSWQEMIGMPSRYTAEEAAHEQRASALQRAQNQDAFEGYSGVRVSRTGQRFMINNARIWTLWDDKGQNCGQAAAFSSWYWL